MMVTVTVCICIAGEPCCDTEDMRQEMSTRSQGIRREGKFLATEWELLAGHLNACITPLSQRPFGTIRFFYETAISFLVQ